MIEQQIEELDRLKNDASKKSKEVKSKENSLETKSENKTQTIMNLKEQCNDLKM